MVEALRRNVAARHGPGVARSVRRIAVSTLSPTTTSDPPSDNHRSARQAASIFVPERYRVVDERWGYAPAVAVRDGAIHVSSVLVFLEGEGTHAERYAAGVRTAWRRIEQVFGTTGATLDDVIRIHSYHTDLARQLEIAARVRREPMAPPEPASTAVGIAALAAPDGVTDFEVTAHKPRSRRLFCSAMHA